jgi:hypothetical protein
MAFRSVFEASALCTLPGKPLNSSLSSSLIGAASRGHSLEKFSRRSQYTLLLVRNPFGVIGKLDNT